MASIIYNTSINELKEYMNSSIFVKEAVEKTGLKDAGSNRRTFYRVMK